MIILKLGLKGLKLRSTLMLVLALSLILLSRSKQGIKNETWHHIIVLTYDIADSEGKALRLYVDNQLVQAWDQFKAKPTRVIPLRLVWDWLDLPMRNGGSSTVFRTILHFGAVLFHPRRSILCTLTELLIQFKVLTKLHTQLLPILLATLLPRPNRRCPDDLVKPVITLLGEAEGQNRRRSRLR